MLKLITALVIFVATTESAVGLQVQVEKTTSPYVSQTKSEWSRMIPQFGYMITDYIGSEGSTSKPGLSLGMLFDYGRTSRVFDTRVF